ncbi:hypothetical protein A4U49_08670 [Acidithiobacillus ferrivorans]|uniref:beta strand repeat-containing protein n=1 Tax=Acidithiobacillus ferrivorans TaxID=160808 RepID=UPI000893CA09|nr:hypothetical protein [Acidithiobacillus ferrivorans]OFA16192.1 hypothetical protein A4U49_08670 [Acidithiobacillus ferrivorans]
MNKKQIMKVSPLVGAVLLALSAPVAMAAVTAPANGTLPGAFSTNQAGTTYTTSGNISSAAINLGGATSPTVLQWGGTPLATQVSAASGAAATAAGFNIGSGATLTVSNAASASAAATVPVLINDLTGSPSQIYGTLSTAGTATTFNLFVANGNGIIVGPSGVINNGTNAVALVGYQANSANFTNTAGAISVTTGTLTSAGDVTINPGAAITAGYLLVAGAGNVNVGAGISTNSALVAGQAFSFTAGAFTPGTGTAALLQTGAVLNINPTAAATMGNIAAAGNVNVAKGSTIVLAAASASVIAGTFTNNGTTTLTDNISAGGIVNTGTLTGPGSGFNITATGAAGINNSGGTINASSNAVTLAATATAGANVVNNGFIINAGSAATINATGLAANNGTINFASSGATLDVTGANINLLGTLNYGATSAPSSFTTTDSLGGVTLATPSTSAGLVLVGTQLYSDGTADAITGQSVRFLGNSGYANTTGTLTVNIGSGQKDGGANLGLAQTGSFLGAKTLDVAGNSKSTIVLGGGTLGSSSTSTLKVTAGSLQIYNGSNGMAVSTTGTANLTLAGNMNNPNMPTNNLYNYQRAVLLNAQGGTPTISLTANGTGSQYMNLAVNGSPTITGGTPVITQPGSVPVGSQASGAFSLSATGNITVGAAGFYYPGTLVLANIANVGAPFSLSGLNSITLTGNLNNTVNNSNGRSGVFFLTNQNLAGAGTVQTNYNSAINFGGKSSLANTSGASNAYSKVFYNLTLSGGILGTQLVPSTYFNGLSNTVLPQ